MKQQQIQQFEKERIYTIQKDGSLVENEPYYRDNTVEFGDIVRGVLNGNTQDVAVRLIETTNTESTTLRIKNVNSDFSENYKDAVIENNRPVVMSGGIFSNLEAWEGDYNGNDFNKKGLAKQLTESGRDVWEIEMTGGKLAECDSCLDYTYEDLRDDYWTASLAAIQYYTDEITVDYVGHSNGCRVALSSLNLYQETGKDDVAKVQDLSNGNWVSVNLQASSSTPIVDTFIGVACPVTLNENTQMSDKARSADWLESESNGNIAMYHIRKQGLTHIYRQDYAKFISAPGIVFARTNEKISTNLMGFYNNLSINTEDSFTTVENLFNKVVLFAGISGYFLLGKGGDGVVPKEDMELLDNNLNNSELYYINENHKNIIKDNILKTIIREKLNE